MPNSGAPEVPAMPDPMIQPGGASPIMNNNAGMDGADPMMGQNPDMNQTPSVDNNQFDTNFDAGVDVNEETDPKKYIQQLTGKLSQSLRKYNEGLPQPDADLDKYVAGMIVKQCIEGLSQENVQEILDKVKTDDTEQPMGNDMNQPQDIQQPMNQPNDNQQPQLDTQMNQPQPPMNENMARRQAISSRYEQFTNDKENGNNDKVTNNNSYHKRPWVGKTFKS